MPIIFAGIYIDLVSKHKILVHLLTTLKSSHWLDLLH